MSDFPIPAAALEDHIAILGKTGSGKTSTSKAVVEHVVADDFRVCVLDSIKSDWWGITSSANGKKPGLPFKILGGPRGHVPLHSSAGTVIGQLVGSGKLPLSIVDMADFEAGGPQRFFVDFATALMKSMRGVVYLVIEEAHEFAPKERAGFGAENLSIHWAKKLATAGRSKGVRLIVATQRVQALHNAVLGSCETVITHRLTAPADQEPVVKWLKANADKETTETVAASLSSLPTGTGWVCSGAARIFERVEFPKFRTFDNTATPTRDGQEVKVETARVDQDELRSIIGAAVAEAEANDPRKLKAEIARLTAELAKAGKAVPAPDPAAIAAAEERAYRRGLSDGERREWQRAFDAAAARNRAAIEQLDRDLAEFAAFKDERPPAQSAPQGPATPAALPQRPALAPRPPAPPPRAAAPANAADGAVPAGCAKPLGALAGVYPSGLTEAQWATAAGYKRSGGTWGTYKSRLRGAGLIEPRDGRWFATEAGAGAAGDVELPPPPGPELVRWWSAKLPGTSKVAEALIEAWPGGLDRDHLAAAVGMSAAGGSFGTYLSRLAGPGLIERNGRVVRLSEDVMGAS